MCRIWARHYVFTFNLHRSKDDSKQIDSSSTKPKKVLKMIQCETFSVNIYFIVTEAAVNIEIIKSDFKYTLVDFNIGNETSCTQSFTFVNVTIVECKY